MSIESIVEELLAGYERRFAAATNAGELQTALLDFRRELARDAARLGASSRDHVMLRGMVVKREALAPLLPRVEAVESGAERRLREFADEAARQAEAAWTHTLRLHYAATLLDADDDDVAVTDRAQLRKCHGATDETDLDGVDFGRAPVVPLAVHARVEFDESTARLAVVIEVPLSKPPTAAQVKAIAKRVSAQLYQGWGLNYEFALPPEVDGRVRFETDLTRTELASR